MANKKTLKYTKISDGEIGELVPGFHMGDVGIDIFVSRSMTIKPGEITEVPSNVAIELPMRYWGLIVGRSSTFRRLNLYVNPGVIDCGWRGELLALVKNVGDKEVSLKAGDRVAQLIVLPITFTSLEKVDRLSASSRGTRGFGSTGS